MEEDAAAGGAPASAQPDDGSERIQRRERRVRLRQAFGTRLLTTFATLLTVATAVVFAVAGLLIHETTYRALERELAHHLEDVAALCASEVADPTFLQPALSSTRDARRELARSSIQRILLRQREHLDVSGIVVFAVDGETISVLASTRDPAQRDGELGRLYADVVAIDRAAATGAPTSSSLYPEADTERLLKSGYAPVPHAADAAPTVFVGVELPAKFTAAVEEVAQRFLVLGALAGLTVLATAIFLVRQRVHVPIYRLVRAMKGQDGSPQRARVRWPDEIGVLTDHYNRMVERLTENERELRELYDRTRERAVYLQGYSDSLVAGVPSGVVAVDAAGVLTVWNPAAARILDWEGRLGAPIEEQLGRNHPLARALKSALAGSVTEQALVVAERPGAAEPRGGDDPLEEDQRLVELTCAPFRGEEGQLLGAAALVNDRTELEQLRRAASRNERLAAIGNLGAGLAHEIKNPLGAISGFAELIERKEGQDAARLARRLREEVEALDTFLREFLAFARDDKIRRDTCDLNELLSRSVEVALQGIGLDPGAVQRVLAGEAVPAPSGDGELRVDLHLVELPPLALDGALLRSAFGNVALNALQVMKGAGRLSVRTSRSEDVVVIAFRDWGPGIPAEDRERIFDPLFTTRAEGTGLGLAMTHKTVVAHGGKVVVRNPPGGGAEFVLRLPVVAAEVGAGAEGRVAQEA